MTTSQSNAKYEKVCVMIKIYSFIITVLMMSDIISIMTNEDLTPNVFNTKVITSPNSNFARSELSLRVDGHWAHCNWITRNDLKIEHSFKTLQQQFFEKGYYLQNISDSTKSFNYFSHWIFLREID